MVSIHPTALVDPAAQLGVDVQVGPYAVIGPDVRIGDRTSVGAHSVIEGRTTIGADNRIFPFNALGAIPQDKKYAGEPCELTIGARNTIREFCTFNIGSPGDQGVTRVGDDNWIMAYTHIAHDCQVGNHTTLANNATLGGHVHLGDWVTVGGLTGIHQFVRVGAHAMLGFASAVAQDVAPFLLVDGNPLAVRGINQIGLRRRDFSDDRIATIKRMYRILFRRNLTLEQARAELQAMTSDSLQGMQDVDIMLSFLQHVTPQRGLAR